jgi:hypothetical protein
MLQAKGSRDVGFVTASRRSAGRLRRLVRAAHEAWFEFALNDQWTAQCLVVADRGRAVLGALAVMPTRYVRLHQRRDVRSRPRRFGRWGALDTLGSVGTDRRGKRELRGGLPASGLRELSLRGLERRLHPQALDLYLGWASRRGLRTSYGKLTVPGEAWFTPGRRSRSPRSGRFTASRLTLERYLEIARVYARAIRAGKGPYRELVRAFPSITVERAPYWVNKARRSGFLRKDGKLTAKARSGAN